MIFVKVSKDDWIWFNTDYIGYSQYELFCIQIRIAKMVYLISFSCWMKYDSIVLWNLKLGTVIKMLNTIILINIAYH